MRIYMIFIVAILAICTQNTLCQAYDRIEGKAEIPAEAFVRFIYSYNPRPLLACSVEELVNDYYNEAARGNIRADIALSQALLETGFFNYGNDVLPEQNNFCGLGATGNSEKGCWFDSPLLGIKAHIQHLAAYCGMEIPAEEIVDPRFWLVKETYNGQIKDIGDLAGHWAMDSNYAEKIEAVLDRARQFAIWG